MKTIKQWLETLPSPIKEKTITIETKDGQSLEISEEKARELGFNIN